MPAWKVRDRGFEPHSGIQVSMKHKFSSPLTRKDSLLSDRQGSNFVFCVWMAVSFHSSHHSQVGGSLTSILSRVWDSTLWTEKQIVRNFLESELNI